VDVLTGVLTGEDGGGVRGGRVLGGEEGGVLRNIPVLGIDIGSFESFRRHLEWVRLYSVFALD
jgi:hypothetical protein